METIDSSYKYVMSNINMKTKGRHVHRKKKGSLKTLDKYLAFFVR